MWEENNKKTAQTQSEIELLFEIIHNTSEGLFVLDNQANYVLINPASERIMGYSSEEWIGKRAGNAVNPQDRQMAEEYLIKAINGEKVSFEAQVMGADKSYRRLNIGLSSLKLKDKTYILGFVVDNTERKIAEENLRQQSSFREAVIKRASEGICVCHNIPEYPFVRFTLWNDRMTKITGYTIEEINALGWYQTLYTDPEIRDKAIARMSAMREGDDILAEEWTITSKDGQKRTVEISTTILETEADTTRVMALMRDITDTKTLEEQLFQSQKMEALGRLAGGVAHDFNNQLTVILGAASLLAETFSPNDPRSADIKMMINAAEKSAALTNQLLAFSRRQIIDPKVLRINDIVNGLKKMLGRLIGEDIDLVTIADAQSDYVKVDPSQIEQVIINLAVNARDAMPNGGTLVIETSEVILDDEYEKNHLMTKPGSYVMLAVSDTGQGMDKETQSHIFEPFFTTKASGKGTGLGLATVYGVVKQYGGNINVYSEPGAGATFKIYLPKLDRDGVEFVEKESIAVQNLTGNETILVVEDDELVRQTIINIIANQGYRVLDTGSPKDAIEISDKHKNKIDLLITDVIMSGMTGWELSKDIAKIITDIKVIFISGYTDNVIAHHGVLDAGIQFLQKPFNSISLLKKIREVLDS